MTVQEILAAIQGFEAAMGALATIRADLSAADQAAINAAVTRSGAALDGARGQLDTDAAAV
jgi:hypothetical protein